MLGDQSFITVGIGAAYNWERYENFSKDNCGMKLSGKLSSVVA